MKQNKPIRNYEEENKMLTIFFPVVKNLNIQECRSTGFLSENLPCSTLKAIL